MTQAHLYVSGFVQGVGYRVFVRSQARKLGITGWVRNLTDERVEAVLQGEKEKVNKLIEICKKGPFLAEVKDMSVEWEEPQEAYSSFEKLPTV